MKSNVAVAELTQGDGELLAETAGRGEDDGGGLLLQSSQQHDHVGQAHLHHACISQRVEMGRFSGLHVLA